MVERTPTEIGRDIKTALERTDDKDGVSTKHPHEPAIPPALDAEGRCLVCALTCELATERANRAIAARVDCERANELLKAMGGDPAYSLLDNAKRLRRDLSATRQRPAYSDAIDTALEAAAKVCVELMPGPTADGLNFQIQRNTLENAAMLIRSLKGKSYVSVPKCWRCGNPMAEDRPFCPASEISAPCNSEGPPVPPKHRPVA